MRVFARIQSWFSLRDDERGASLVEYALLLALIAMVVLGAVTVLGSTTSGAFSEFTSELG